MFRLKANKTSLYKLVGEISSIVNSGNGPLISTG